VKFQVLDIIPHQKNPVTGEIVSTADRLDQVVQTARRAEDLGYDSFSVGERHAGEFNVPGNNSPFRDIDHAVAEGPALVGSPEQVIDKILSYHALYGHDLQSISLPTTLPFEQQLEILERFALEVIPAVRASAPTTLWESADPFGSRPSFAGATEPDAASAVTTDHSNHRSQNAYVYAH
jgi:alkanesulfonate monooxygenase SsuD/methylene tetrahydromethanopterin reductase-like flavin-dependent oxidoreductase (luciferase family)